MQDCKHMIDHTSPIVRDSDILQVSPIIKKLYAAHIAMIKTKPATYTRSLGVEDIAETR